MKGITFYRCVRRAVPYGLVLALAGIFLLRVLGCDVESFWYFKTLLAFGLCCPVVFLVALLAACRLRGSQSSPLKQTSEVIYLACLFLYGAASWALLLVATAGVDSQQIAL